MEIPYTLVQDFTLFTLMRSSQLIYGRKATGLYRRAAWPCLILIRTISISTISGVRGVSGAVIQRFSELCSEPL